MIVNWNFLVLVGNVLVDICYNVLWLVCSCRYDLYIRDLDVMYLEEFLIVMFVNIVFDINDIDVM